MIASWPSSGASSAARDHAALPGPDVVPREREQLRRRIDVGVEILDDVAEGGARERVPAAHRPSVAPLLPASPFQQLVAARSPVLADLCADDPAQLARKFAALLDHDAHAPHPLALTHALEQRIEFGRQQHHEHVVLHDYPRAATALRFASRSSSRRGRVPTTRARATCTSAATSLGQVIATSLLITSMARFTPAR